MLSRRAKENETVGGVSQGCNRRLASCQPAEPHLAFSKNTHVGPVLRVVNLRAGDVCPELGGGRGRGLRKGRRIRFRSILAREPS